MQRQLWHEVTSNMVFRIQTKKIHTNDQKLTIINPEACEYVYTILLNHLTHMLYHLPDKPMMKTVKQYKSPDQCLCKSPHNASNDSKALAQC
jgi:hypothetical protein